MERVLYEDVISIIQQHQLIHQSLYTISIFVSYGDKRQLIKFNSFYGSRFMYGHFSDLEISIIIGTMI